MSAALFLKWACLQHTLDIGTLKSTSLGSTKFEYGLDRYVFLTPSLSLLLFKWTWPTPSHDHCDNDKGNGQNTFCPWAQEIMQEA